MPIRMGYIVGSAQNGETSPYISDDLAGYVFAPWGPGAYAVGAQAGLDSGTALHTFPVRSAAAVRDGYAVNSYLQDYYYRIHVRPKRLDLGNVVNSLSEPVEVWSAWLEPRTLQSISVLNGDGLSVIGDTTTPQTWAPLTSKVYEIALSSDGTGSLDAQVVWTFDVGTGELSVTANRVVAWPVPPHWGGEGLRESLAWMTDVLRARNGRAQKRALRQTPRRGFEFEVKADGRERRVLDAMLFDWSSRTWALPIWPEVQRLPSALPAGAASIACRTDGFDFAAGGLAMLWAGVNRYEVVEIDTVGAGKLTLKRITAQAWPAGVRLYPVRAAHLQDWPEASGYNDNAGRLPVRFELAEDSPWPAQLPATLYRDLPVLEGWTEESDDPTASYPRVVQRIDNGTGPVRLIDYPGQPFRVGSWRWKLAGRTAQAELRSLLYGLKGRFKAVWVPSSTADLQLLAPVLSASTVLVVDWCGYARFGRQQSNRRDIRIGLRDGTALYRRITGAAEIDADTEQLSLDAALGQDVSPGDVRAINFLTLSSLASDTVEWQHVTDADGVARVAVDFAGERHDD